MSIFVVYCQTIVFYRQINNCFVFSHRRKNIDSIQNRLCGFQILSFSFAQFRSIRNKIFWQLLLVIFINCPHFKLNELTLALYSLFITVMNEIFTISCFNVLFCTYYQIF